MKIFYFPQGLRCPNCKNSLWCYDLPSTEGKVIMQCLSIHCFEHNKIEIQLPSVEAKYLAEGE